MNKKSVKKEEWKELHKSHEDYDQQMREKEVVGIFSTKMNIKKLHEEEESRYYW